MISRPLFVWRPVWGMRATVLVAVKGRARCARRCAVSSLDRSCAPWRAGGVGTKGVPTFDRASGGSNKGLGLGLWFRMVMVLRAPAALTQQVAVMPLRAALSGPGVTFLSGRNRDFSNGEQHWIRHVVSL